MMDYKKRWEIIGECGGGGQGKVYRVYDKTKFDIEGKISPAFIKSIQTVSSAQRGKAYRNSFESFRKAVLDIIGMEDPVNHGALKVLHKPEEARDAELAPARLKQEIEAMSNISHPNLLKIIDVDPDSKWFVSQFHPEGTLDDHRNLFTGDLERALKAFRPLVEGVSEVHKQSRVHRDIKPQNIFLASNDNLILGDFGLVFFADQQRTRYSRTFENVGTRDWMPGWAMTMRIEDVKPTFDVFSLGKVLWAMVSEKPVLNLWYFERPLFNLEDMFPDDPSMKLANRILKKCVVENEKDCLPDATALLDEVDKILLTIHLRCDPIGDNIERLCRTCGIGKYERAEHQGYFERQLFGLNLKANEWRVFTCNHCGHVQLFSIGKEITPVWFS